MGYKGHLPWRDARMENDTKRLHRLTNKNIIVMGEKTYHDYKNVQEAFHTKQVYVISRSTDSLPDANVLNDINDVATLAKSKELWVIGGGSIFKQLLPNAGKMFLTIVNHEFTADTFFPKYKTNEWDITSKQDFPADSSNPYSYTFLELCRKN